MSVLHNNKELIVMCHCGCDSSVKLGIEKDDDMYAYMCYLNGNYYKEQEGFFFRLRVKLTKIWCILRNKDYCYSDIIMSKDEWETFKSWVNMQ